MELDIMPADIIAIVTIIGYFFLMSLGSVPELPPAFLLIMGYYFGHSAHNGRTSNRTQNDTKSSISSPELLARTPGIGPDE